MKSNRLAASWAILCALLLPLANAVEIDANCAALAARNWTVRGGLLGAKISSSVERTDRLVTDSGAAFYAVSMAGGGVVFTSADTEDEPIVAFADGTNDVASIDSASPLWALLNRRFSRPAVRARRTLSAVAPEESAASRRWAALTNAPRRVSLASTYIDGTEKVVGDLRVPPLTKSKWNQGSGPRGIKCWNFCTPNNYLCGCVATAMAQVMYFHRWPEESPQQKTFKCYSDGATLYLTTKGGRYDWDLMVDKPEAKTFTAEMGAAIGKLTYDCGVSVRMSYYQDASAAFDHYSVNQFKNLFGYASATYFDCYNGEKKGHGTEAYLLTNNLAKVMFANFDAGYPVMLGVDGPTGGHEIVGDGYGYNDGLAYVHLNMGFGGGTDYWYLLPDMNGASNSNFSMVDDVIYNIIPGTESNLAVFSGRVVDTSGNGVSNVIVCVKEVSGGKATTVTNVTCNAYGVYGVCFLPKSDATYRAEVAGVSGYEDGQSEAVAVSAPTVKTEWMGYEEDIERLVFKGEDIGNSWGNDIVLTAKTPGAPSTEDEGLDIRVDQLVRSEWDQLYAGGGLATWLPVCYNYHTPDHRHSGCVPTALAQVMRFHEWPKEPVAANSYTCKVYNADSPVADALGMVKTNLTMIGGTYDWSKMPLTTTYETSDDEREMIGRLLYDVGVSISAKYENGQTSAGAYAAIHSFPKNFHYANCEAIFWEISANMSSYDEALFKRMVIPSLDAGLPCVLGIAGGVGGHAVVCDGYGYENGALRVHVNAGYSGIGDGWHSPTNMRGICGVDYDKVQGVVFNISPTHSGAIASGRVLDLSGQPVAGATVTVRLNGTVRKTMTSNAKGIYSFWGDPGTYDVTAAKDGRSSAVQVALSENKSVNVTQDGAYVYPLATTQVGNSAGNDIVLAEADSVALPTASVADKTTFKGSLSVSLSCVTAGATIRYTTDGTVPTAESPLYTGPIELTSSAVIKAVAMKTGFLPSEIATFTYMETTLGDAVECTSLDWRTGGDWGSGWQVVTDDTYDGVDALRSAPVDSYVGVKDASSWIEADVKGPATVTFQYDYYQYSYCAFVVTLDGEKLVNTKGIASPGWSGKTISIPGGNHVLRFAYVTGGSGHGAYSVYGARIDQISYTYTGSDDEPEDPVDPPVTPPDDPDDPDNPDDPDVPDVPVVPDVPDQPSMVTNRIPATVTLDFAMTSDDNMKVKYIVVTNGVSRTWEDPSFKFVSGQNFIRGNGNNAIDGTGAILVKNFSGPWNGWPVPNTNLEAGGTEAGRYWQIDVPFDLEDSYVVSNVLPKVFITNKTGLSDENGQPTRNNKQYDVNISWLSDTKLELSSAAEIRTDKLGAALVNTVCGVFDATISNGFFRIRMDNSSMPGNGAFGAIQGLVFQGEIVTVTESPNGGGDEPVDPPDDPTPETPVATGTNVVVAPLTQAMWNQGRHYNLMCPTTATGGCDGRMWAGCTAVATAILLKHYEWPLQGTGDTAYDEVYWPADSTNLRARFDRPYDWEAMQDVYGHVTSARASLAIGQLMSDVGAVLSMNYGPSGSGTQFDKVAGVLGKHFHFNNSYAPTIKDFNEENQALIRAQLAAGHPVLCSGAANAAGVGHTYVCDGCAQVTNVSGTVGWLYHFNFGWGGTNNGWYPLNAVLSSAVPGETPSLHPVDEMLLGVLPQRTPLFAGLDRIAAPDMTVRWGVASCWTNLLNGFTLERQEKRTSLVDTSLVADDWFIHKSGDDSYGWNVGSQGVVSGTVMQSWGSTYWPGWGNGICSVKGVPVSAETTVMITYKARKLPTGVTLRLTTAMEDPDTGEWSDMIPNSYNELPTLVTLRCGDSDSELDSITETISGADLMKVLGGAEQEVHFAINLANPNGVYPKWTAGTEVFRLESFTVSGSALDWVTQETLDLPSSARTAAFENLPEKDCRFTLTAKYDDGDETSSQTVTVSSTVKAPEVSVVETTDQTVVFEVSGTDAFSCAFEKQSNALKGTWQKTGCRVTYAFDSSVSQVGTHWLTLTVSNTVNGLTSKCVHVTNPPEDHPLCASAEPTVAAAAARGRDEGKPVLLLITGEPDNSKFGPLSGFLATNEIVEIVNDKYVVTELCGSVPSQFPVAMSYWRSQPAGLGQPRAAFDPKTKGYCILIDPRQEMQPIPCSTETYGAPNSQLDLTFPSVGIITVPNLINFLKQDFGLNLEPERDPEPSVEGGDDSGTFAKNEAGEYVFVPPFGGSMAVAVNDVGTNTIVVPPGVQYVIGVPSDQIRVKYGAYDVGRAFVFTPDVENGVVVLTLDAERSVEIDNEMISVRPELSPVGSDELATTPFAIGGIVSVGVKAIPGLKYTLLRGATPEALSDSSGAEDVASAVAEGSRVRLVDSATPVGKAFYLIRVEIP